MTGSLPGHGKQRPLLKFNIECNGEVQYFLAVFIRSIYEYTLRSSDDTSINLIAQGKI